MNFDILNCWNNLVAETARFALPRYMFHVPPRRSAFRRNGISERRDLKITYFRRLSHFDGFRNFCISRVRALLSSTGCNMLRSRHTYAPGAVVCATRFALTAARISQPLLTPEIPVCICLLIISCTPEL